jgi:hypothetical protein
MLRLAPADADSELWRHFRVSWIVLILPSVSPRRSESDTSYVVSPFSRGSNVPASKTTHIIGTSLLSRTSKHSSQAVAVDVHW